MRTGELPEGLHDVPEYFPLPCDDEGHWSLVQNLKAEIRDFQTLSSCMSSYGAFYRRGAMLRGLQIAVAGMEQDFDFFGKVLPFMIDLALQLPELRKKLPGGRLPILRHRRRGDLTIPRDLGASLLANMVLCTVVPSLHRAMPGLSFESLLEGRGPQEVAKLQMVLHYFDRIREQPPLGSIRITRMVETALTEEEWTASSMPLLPLDLAPPRVGFELDPTLAHADFANMFIGGGVLSGGCVQEEIRFAICPELLLSLLVCPVMLPDEAIQIRGSEQFSAYRGYAFSLEYGGDHVDITPRAADGSVLSEVLAMDALDLRGEDESLEGQLSSWSMTRELNKALAAFIPVDEESLRHHPVIATGNWGCGAFLGCVQLKALLQWASASQCGRRLKYFPFEQVFGPELQRLSQLAVQHRATVGQLLSGLCGLRRERPGRSCADYLPWPRPRTLDPAELFRFAADVVEGPKRASPDGPPTSPSATS